MTSRRCWRIPPSPNLVSWSPRWAWARIVAGMFHLVTHAFFKALLFLSAGSVILGRGAWTSSPGTCSPSEEVNDGKHRRKSGRASSEGSTSEVFDPNDMRNMGGLRKTMPVTFWLYMIGTLALAGIFPFAGFWSKDEILLDASLHYPDCLLAVDHRRLLHRFLHGTPDLDGLLRRASHTKPRRTPRKAHR